VHIIDIVDAASSPFDDPPPNEGIIH